MLGRIKSVWRRSDANDASNAEQITPEARRNKQKNLKASPACIAAFAHIADVLQMSEAALFEDMVAARWEELRRSGRLK